MIVTEMSEQACLGVLARAQVGHLACASNNQPYVVPVSFAFAGNSLYAFSLPGQKIDWLRGNRLACVHVQEPGQGHDWQSVVVTGLYKELTDAPDLRDERDLAWSLLQRQSGWWEPGALKPDAGHLPEALRPIYFSISIAALSGRQSAESPSTETP